MSKWEKVKLGECFTLSSGRFLPTKKRVDGECSVFGGNGIIGKHNEYFIDNPTVVIGRVGQYCGCVHTTSEKVWVTDNALYVTEFLKTIDRDYICYALNQKNLNSFANKSGQPSISQSAILKIEISLPPLETQKQIAKTLETASELLAMRKQQLAELDNLIKSTFYDMFGDPVANEKGWDTGIIKDLADKIQYGTSGKASLNQLPYPILRMNNITYEGNMDFSDLKYIDLKEKDKEKYLVHKGELLFNRTNSKGLVGKTAVYREDNPAAYAGYLIRLVPNEKANSEFISAYLNSSYGKKLLLKMAKNIIGMANINAKELSNIKIYIPPITLQNQFAKIVTKIEEQKALVKKAIDETQYLFDSLMSKYFD